MGSGTEKCYWRDLLTVRRKTDAGRDPDTLLPTYGVTTILEGEPCDLAVRSREIVSKTDAGTTLVTVKKTILRLEPDNETSVPDENDEILVNNEPYVFQELVEVNRDPISGEFLGAVIRLQKQLKVQ